MTEWVYTFSYCLIAAIYKISHYLFHHDNYDYCWDFYVDGHFSETKIKAFWN